MEEAKYHSSDVLSTLKQAGLPCSYPRLLFFERKGIIPGPDDWEVYGERKDRKYRQSTLDLIVIKVREYKESLNVNKKES